MSDLGFIKAPGLSIKEIEILVDLLERSCEEARFAWALGITVRAVGGLKYTRDHSLPVALAIMNAFRRQQISEQYVVLGDMDLRGNVLPLSSSAVAIISDLQAAGILDERSLLCGPLPEELRDELSDVRRHTVANILNLPDYLSKGLVS